MTRSKKLRLFFIMATTAAAVIVWVSLREQSSSQQIPRMLAASLPPQCQQVLLVLAADDHAIKARMWMLERAEGTAWHQVDSPIDVTVGQQGLAWGTGEHTAQRPASFRIKHEGDMCSPAGVFRIPFAFGTAPAAPDLKLPYTPLTPSIIGVDDPASRYYNQVVDNTKVSRDWDSNEPMIRRDHLYEWGAFIANNPTSTPDNGSCIFLHLWSSPGESTAGCTSMSGKDLKRVLTWLDPAKEPRLVQGIEEWSR